MFSIPQKDLKKFTEQAKRYGVLYSVLKDRNAKGKNVTVDIIARAEDASKIDRIIERFKLGTVDKGSITNEVEKSVNALTDELGKKGFAFIEVEPELIKNTQTGDNLAVMMQLFIFQKDTARIKLKLIMF